MRAEPEFQSATPTGFAEQTAHAQAGADQSEIHILAGDRVDAANSSSSGSANTPKRDFLRIGDVRRIVSRSIGGLRENLNRIRASVTVRSSLVGGALVLGFGLGW